MTEDEKWMMAMTGRGRCGEDRAGEGGGNYGWRKETKMEMGRKQLIS